MRCIVSEGRGSRDPLGAYAWVSTFVEKIACVRDRSGKYFHVRENGTPLYVTGRGYDFVGHFYENFAIARLGTREFHIRRDGRPAYNEYYMLVGPFTEGLALARDRSGYFHIRTNGLPAYTQRYDETRSFSGGFAIARIGRYFVYIKPDGTLLTREYFSYATPFHKGFAIVIKDHDELLIDDEGKTSE